MDKVTCLCGAQVDNTEDAVEEHVQLEHLFQRARPKTVLRPSQQAERLEQVVDLDRLLEES